MPSFTKLFTSFLVSLVAIPFAASAADIQAVVVADVNVTSHTITVSGKQISGKFMASSSMGNQDAVAYGFVLRSKQTGKLLDVTPILGTLTLKQGEGIMTSVSYALPALPSEAAQVYLNLSNKQGVIMSTVLVGETSASSSVRICTIAGSEGEVSCTAPAASQAVFTAYRGGAQGEASEAYSVRLSAGKTTKIDLADVVEDASAGMYVISGSVVSDDGSQKETFAVEYMKKGEEAKIGSVSIVHMGDMSYKAVVMVDIFGQSRDAFRLSLAPSCGDKQDGIPVSSRVVEIPLNPTCSSGVATVTLYETSPSGNNVIADEVQTSFSIPPAPTTSRSGGYMDDFALIALIAIMLSLVYKLLHHHHESTSSAPPASPIKGAAVAAIIFVVMGMYAPPTASAATASLLSSWDWVFCTGGGGEGCGEAKSILAQGTVTYPSSVNANSSYTVSVSQQMYSANIGTETGCQDSAADTWTCDSNDVRTTFQINGTSVGSADHVSSYSFSRTAPASGSISLTGLLRPWAPYYFGCRPPNSPVKCSGMYDDSEGQLSVSIPVSAAPPVVDIQFSLLEKMFKVFALNK